MLVDSRSTYSVIPKALAQSLGITDLRPVRISGRGGHRIKVDTGLAVFALGGREAPSPVLVADVDEPTLGVGTLDALGFQVDIHQLRLKRRLPDVNRL
jgi:predicted aspartyl protease